MELGSGLILLLVGVIVGVIAGLVYSNYQNRKNNSDAKLAALRKEYDDYRANVRSHFIDTVSAISKIDEQQKELYRSVAHGVNELCRPEDGKEDYFLEQTMQTLGELEPPKKDDKDSPKFN